MRTLFSFWRKAPQQKLYRWSGMAEGWVDETPLTAEERAEMEKQWPKFDPETMTVEESVAWFEERFQRKARR